MTQRQDILLDENFDMIIENGQIKTGKSDAQHCRLILATNKGDWSQYKRLGVGVTRLLQGNLDGVFRRDVQLQLASDGYNIKSISYDNNSGKLDVKIE